MELMRKYAWAFGLAGTLALIGGVTLGWAYGGVEGRPQTLLVAGAVLLLLYALFDREQIGEAVQTRTFVHGGSSLILVALAASAAVTGYALAKKHDQTWDLTRERSFTLSDHSTGVLQAMSEPVQVLAFFRKDAQELKQFSSLMDRMREHTDKLEVQYVDPLRKPKMAEDYEVTSERGTVILERADGKRQRIDVDFDEENLIQKLVLLQAQVEHRVCWALGHGEPDPDDEFDERGLGVAVIELEELNYQVTRQMIPTSGIDPACEALVIARPTLEWQEWELEALAAYLASSGRVLMLLEPDASPTLSEELARYGIGMRRDVVLDPNPENQLMGVDDPTFVVLHGPNLLSHPITANLAAAVVLPIARSVEPDMGASGVRAQAVMQTSVLAWGEVGGDDPMEMPTPDPSLELVGEVPVMAVSVVEDPSVLEVADPDQEAGRGIPEDFAPKEGGRLVVIGDGDFAANGYISLGNNRDLFLNSIAWLVEEEDQIGERPEAGETMAIDDLSAAFLCLISVVFVPGGVGALALVTWFRRRRL